MGLHALVVSAFLLIAPVMAMPNRLSDESRDHAKEEWVRQALARLGASNAIRVYRDDSLRNGTTCAYASVQGNFQVIVYDGGCVTSLEPLPPDSNDSNLIKNHGVMYHEVAHAICHTAARGDKKPMDREIEAERMAGFLFRYNNAPLNQALIYAQWGLVEDSDTHPGRAVRLRVVEEGWRNADAVLTGLAAGVPPVAVTSLPPAPVSISIQPESVSPVSSGASIKANPTSSTIGPQEVGLPPAVRTSFAFLAIAITTLFIASAWRS